MKILVTGGAGYIGSIVIEELLKLKYEVICLDRLTFGDNAVRHHYGNPLFTLKNFDIRNYELLKELILENDFFAVLHLAAIVGDPACKLYTKETKEINVQATLNLLELCNSNKVKKFIFASTCSNYGKMNDDKKFVDENSPLKPISLYAETKVEIENFILNNLDRNNYFSPTILRFSTVYGLSKRMRFDLTVNEFARDAFYNKKLIIYGENFWRPYCHVNDFAAAFIKVLNAEKNIHYNVFNVGNTDENYSKKMLAEIILKNISETKIEYVFKRDDPRDYRVNCDKISNLLGFKTSKSVNDGVVEIIDSLRHNTLGDVYSQNFYNIPIK